MKTALTLIIGDKQLSSWSLRPWLLLTHFSIDFNEQVISLDPEGLSDRLSVISPTAKVPVLQDAELLVWDSLAICEYLNDTYLQGTGWPDDIKQRAIARSLCAEMHSGFSEIRQHYPMDTSLVDGEQVDSLLLEKELARVDAIWSEYASSSATGWLFDQFSIADCFFAPIALRIRSYQLSNYLSSAATSYYQKLLNLSALQLWCELAESERRTL